MQRNQSTLKIHLSRIPKGTPEKVLHKIIQIYVRRGYTLKIYKGKGNAIYDSAHLTVRSYEDYHSMLRQERIMLESTQEFEERHRGVDLIRVRGEDGGGFNYFVIRGREVEWIVKKMIIVKPFKTQEEIRKDTLRSIGKRFYVNGLTLLQPRVSEKDDIQPELNALRSRLAWKLRQFGEIDTIFLKELTQNLGVIKCYVEYTHEISYVRCLRSMKMIYYGVYEFEFEGKTLIVIENVDSELENFAFGLSTLTPSKGDTPKKKYQPRSGIKGEGPKNQGRGSKKKWKGTSHHPSGPEKHKPQDSRPKIPNIHRGRDLHHSAFVPTTRPIHKDCIGRTTTERFSLLRVSEPTSSFTTRQFSRLRPRLSGVMHRSVGLGSIYCPFREHDRHFWCQVEREDLDHNLSKRHKPGNLKFNKKRF